MWAIDRTDLIVVGIVLGVLAVVGIGLWLVSPPSPSPVGPATDPVVSHPQPTQDPVAVVADPEPEPESDPTPPPLSAPVPDALASSVPIIDGTIHTGEYRHAMEAGGFRVYWSNDVNVLRVGLFSPGTGYVAVGFDPDRRMQGANFIIGTVRNGRVDIRDDYGIGSLTHGSDLAQGGTDDILAAAGRELNGQTTLEFIIPLDSGDPYDKPLVPGETYDILVAFHNTSDTFSTRHSQRGSGQIRLDDPSP